MSAARKAGRKNPDYKPHQVARNDAEAVWSVKNNSSGKVFAALFNLSDGERIVSVNGEELGAADDKLLLEDLWTGEKFEERSILSCRLPPHGCRIFKIY